LVELFSGIIGAIMGGGPEAMIAILVVFVVLLLLDRRRLLAEIKQKDAKVEKIVDEYYKGNLTLTEALTSLKLVLFEIKGKL